MALRHYLSVILLLFVSGLASTVLAAEAYKLTLENVEQTVERELEALGAGEKVKILLIGDRSPIAFSHPTPISAALSGLHYDAESKRWEAELMVAAEEGIIAQRSISGRYETLEQIPVLTRRLYENDVIGPGDIELLPFSETRLRKDVIRDVNAMLNHSPRRMISPARPIRTSELRTPIMIEEGKRVQMFYQTPHMVVRTIGEALEKGSFKEMIRVKNLESGIVVQALVESDGEVSVTRPRQMATR